MTPSPKRFKIKVFVVSDATGITAERVTRAVLVHFEKQVEAEIVRCGNIRSIQQFKKILDEAEKTRSIVIYSIVSHEITDWIMEQRRIRNIEIIDLLGPLIDRMTKLFHVLPTLHPGLLGIVGEESVRLAESIDFTLRHDDGQNIDTLGKADLILLGVSRTSKTPTSLYISCNHNLKVANIPLIPQVQPPRKIFTLKRPKKVGFTISPNKLANMRQRRLKQVPSAEYIDLKIIHQELAFSHSIFKQINNCKVIDVTNCSIEEVAKQIMEE